jgi:hypothetical protein
VVVQKYYAVQRVYFAVYDYASVPIALHKTGSIARANSLCRAYAPMQRAILVLKQFTYEVLS